MPEMTRTIALFMFTCSGSALGADPESAAWWVSAVRQTVHSAPDQTTTQQGHIAPNEPFAVLERIEGAGCDGYGWGIVEGGGHVCLQEAHPSDEPPVRLPRLVAFVHPDPTEWETYLATKRYERRPEEGVPALVPFIYAKRWRQWKAPTYASMEAYANGAPSLRRLGGLRKYHFVRSEETERGTVLVRNNGQVVPLDDAHVYPLSKFGGWDLRREPLPDATLPAWAINYSGTPVHRSPDKSSPVGRRLPYHTPILVTATPVDSAGHWWEMKDAFGPNQPGFVHDVNDIRHWVPSLPPPGVGDSELWVDVDLGQQVLALRRGTQTEFVTLVSTGAVDWATPRGLYQIMDKTIYGDMQSRADAEEPYHVEKVPWVMHFWPRYAIHGVFWHWGFGHRASHGCINMSVRDARTVFDRIHPTTHDGWMTAFSTPSDVGTTLRVRRGDAPVRDRRRHATD